MKNGRFFAVSWRIEYCMRNALTGKRKNDKIKMMSTNAIYTMESVGIFTPKKVNVQQLSAGEVGYFTGQIKQVADCKVGDTIILSNDITSVSSIQLIRSSRRNHVS